MRIGRYLNQNIIHQPFSNTNDNWGNRAYSTSRTIKGRKEEKQNVVRDRAGAEHTSDATVITETEIQLGELLDGREVQARENFVDRKGAVIGWKSFL